MSGSIRWLSPLLVAAVLALGVGLSAPCAAALGPALFSTEQAAQHHCPVDTVVWLNVPSGVFHFKGQRWYANTRNGAFVCEKEALAAGDRATRNGQ